MMNKEMIEAMYQNDIREAEKVYRLALEEAERKKLVRLAELRKVRE